MAQAQADNFTQDEAIFMQSLLSGVDSSYFDPVPSSDYNPKRSKKASAESIACTQENPNCKTDALLTESDVATVTNSPAGSGDIDLATLLEGAEDWDWSDMTDDLLSSASEKVAKSKPAKASVESQQPVFRCTVQSMDLCGQETTLNVLSEDGMDRRVVILADDWLETEVHPGDTLNVIGPFSTPSTLSTLPTITVSAKQNLIVLHPDTLLTATSVANAPHCARRPLLSLLLRPMSDSTPALVWGSVLHEVMQRCLAGLRWDESHIEALVDDIVQKNLEDLVRIGVGLDEAKTEVRKRAGGLRSFGERFIGKTPKTDAILTNTRAGHGSITRLAITQLLDVEEDIWAPKYGLKGKIDASIEGRLEEYASLAPQYKRYDSTPQLKLIASTSTPMPLEIKTGRAIAGMEHRAQTMLYTLLMSERYGTPLPGYASGLDPVSAPTSSAPSGLLYYTQSEEVIRVPSGWNEVRGLIMARNEMAGYLMRRIRKTRGNKSEDNQSRESAESKNDQNERSFLPPTIDQERACSRCYAADACMLYKKAIEGAEDLTSPIAELYRLKTSHLTLSQLAFFRKWEHLITLEEQDIARFRKELWTIGAREREEKGRCLAAMVLDTKFDYPINKYTKDNRIRQFAYRFIRQKYYLPMLAAGRAHGCQSPSLLQGHIMAGEAITVSVADDPRFIALARGFVLELTPDGVVVSVDHVLSTDFIRARSDRYQANEEIVFRIDKDEMTRGLARVRDNLAQLFYVTGDRRRLELIVDLRNPEFGSDICIPSTKGYETLNHSQQQAVAHVLRASDYALILGMPGTGKTTTIAEIIRILVRMGKTVLLTSYTHSAVDTILLKLKNSVDFDILRVGNADKVHPGVREFTLGTQDNSATVEQLERRLLRPPVVATTALSMDHALFSRRRFDYCIVDEASQITLPTCVGPLRFADKFILVGDHFQLPPLVKSQDARKGGLDVSLFRRLSDAHPSAVKDLAFQYRMNADIMLLSNRLIYNNRLKCGSLEVANRFLQIPNKELADSACDSSASGPRCWLWQVMDERCKAVFVDTDALPALDSRIGDLIQNEVEASLVQQLTKALLAGGVRQEQIGIISLYRQQVKLLSHLLQECKDVEILTADRSQGRDKDCIIISLVRANQDNQIGDLLKDWRRINVAFTRARSKLVIFGSRKTLKASSLLADFFALMEERGWVLALPPGADTMHNHGDRELPLDSVSRTGAIKRPPIDSDFSSSGGNLTGDQAPPHKKAKKALIENGLTRARPILRDLLNNTK
ncbi:hypothetical protein M0805_008536 [Coniferiporia weirii]|nr:hypothetical protein M0805_008536 [Coniferiporia weirii]